MSSIAANPRKAKVTRSQGIKLRVMADIVPLTPVEAGSSSGRRGFAHRYVMGKDGFVQYVIAGGTDLPEKLESPKSTSVSAQEARNAAEKIGDTWVDFDGKAVRLTTDGDNKGVRGIKRPDKPVKTRTPKSARPERDVPVAPRVTADEIARVARSVGYTGPIDRKMRALILDVIASQRQKASYIEK